MLGTGTQAPPTSPASPTFQISHPPLTLPTFAKMLPSPSKSKPSSRPWYISKELRKMKAVYQLDGRFMYFFADVYHFDPSEKPVEDDGKVIWDTFAKMRASDVVNKLHVPVYKAPEPDVEVEAGQDDVKEEKKENDIEVWQDPETGLFWAGGKLD